MTYDFDTLVLRRETNSYKWAILDNEIPMWVADMDFYTAPEIRQALHQRIEQDGFGYTYAGAEYNQAIANWYEKQHDYVFTADAVLFSPGVITAIRSILKVISSEGQKICLLTPVYHTFFHVIEQSKRLVIESEMIYQDGQYTIDYRDLEAKLADPLTMVMILCNPHNPTGQLWSQTDLQKICNLCQQHDVKVISDEIHCDLTHPGHTFVPCGVVDSSVITCFAASKSFNLAGLKGSAIIINDPQLRGQISQQLRNDGVQSPTVFACVATKAALNLGETWLNELNQYLSANRQLLIDEINHKCPHVHVVDAKATYLAWLDCSKVTSDSQAFCQFIRAKTGLYLSAGNQFKGNGTYFVRWNYACPRQLLQDAINRFVQGVNLYVTERGEKHD